MTGCDTGLGVEFARQYAADGHRVIATCLDPASARETTAIRGRIDIVGLDVTDHGAIERLAAQLENDRLTQRIGELGRQASDLAAERDRLNKQATTLSEDKSKLNKQVADLTAAQEKQARELAAAMSEREKLAAELLALTGDRDKLAALLKAAEAKALTTSADAQKAAEAGSRASNAGTVADGCDDTSDAGRGVYSLDPNNNNVRKFYKLPDEDQAVGPAGRRAAVLDQQGRQGLGTDRYRPGEALVLSAGAIGDRGRHHPVQVSGGGAGHRGRDPGIGIERQVGTMLFGGSQRDQY